MLCSFSRTFSFLCRVQKDVIESLNLQSPLVLKSSFNRPNIYYEGQLQGSLFLDKVQMFWYVINEQPVTNQFLWLPTLKSMRNQLSTVYSTIHFFAFTSLNFLLAFKNWGEGGFKMAIYDSVAFSLKSWDQMLCKPNLLHLSFICCMQLCVSDKISMVIYML